MCVLYIYIVYIYIFIDIVLNPLPSLLLLFQKIKQEIRYCFEKLFQNKFDFNDYPY